MTFQSPDFGPLESLFDWLALHPVERGFLRSLAENRLDGDLCSIFADYLEEHGRDEAGRRVRLLRPVAGDLLVVWVFSGLSSNERQTIGEYLQGVCGGEVGVIIFSGKPDVETVTRCDPARMRELGWVRAEEADTRVREEREACARIVDRTRYGGDLLGEIIRARGEQTEEDTTDV